MNGSELMRYCGSPLPMGFGEAEQQKSVCLVTFEQTRAGAKGSVQLLDVPVFQKLERIRGDWGEVSARIFELSAGDSRAWLEVIHEGDEVIGDLRKRLDEAIEGSGMEILRVKNMRIIERALGQLHDQEKLPDLNEQDVFERCLTAHEVPEEQRPELLRAYRETLESLSDEDPRAE